MTPDVSIIIPAKIRTEEEADWLKTALYSAQIQDEVAEIIVVDDHSLIEWGKVEEIVGDYFNQVKVIRNLSSTGGLAHARNMAMEQVRTKFFFPLDADDYLADEAIKNLRAAYTDGFVYGTVVMVDKTTFITRKAEEYDFMKLMQKVYFTSGALQKKTNWKKVGGWDESITIFEDWDYWLSSGKLGICGHAIPETVYYYRRNPNGIISTTRRNHVIIEQAQSAIWSKHKDLYETGETPMGCCGGGKRKTFVVTNHASNKVSSYSADQTLTPPPPREDGTILLKLVGAGGSGLRTFIGQSGQGYRVSALKPFFYSLATDVQGLLEVTNAEKQPMFQRVDGK